MPFSDRTAHLQPEGAYQVLARAGELEAQGRDIIHLEIGQPDFDTPENISYPFWKKMTFLSTWTFLTGWLMNEPN